LESLRNLFRDQPLLAGCGCIVVLMILACGVGAVLLGLGWEKVGGVVNEATGVDSFFDTAVDASAAGLSFEVSNTSESGIEYTLRPHQPREVSCEELKGVLGPHLVGDRERVVIRSTSTIEHEDGRRQVVPIECTWTGAAAVAPEAALPATETAPAEAPVEPPAEAPSRP